MASDLEQFLTWAGSALAFAVVAGGALVLQGLTVGFTDSDLLNLLEGMILGGLCLIGAFAVLFKRCF